MQCFSQIAPGDKNEWWQTELPLAVIIVTGNWWVLKWAKAETSWTPLLNTILVLGICFLTPDFGTCEQLFLESVPTLRAFFKWVH